MKISREFLLLMPRGKKFLSPVHDVGDSRGPFLGPPWVHMSSGMPEANGLESQQAIPWGVRAAPTSMGMGFPAKFRCRGFPRGPGPSQVEEVAGRS